MVALALVACVPRVHLSVVEAEDVTVPPDVRAIAIVDRTDAGDAAAATTAGLAEILERSGRFALAADPAAADAVATLEAFTSETRVAVVPRIVTEEVDGETVERTVWDARRDTKVEVTWALSDGGPRVLDHLADVGTSDVWVASGASEAEAIAGLPTEEETVRELGRSTGIAYGRRIAPAVEGVVRDYFVRGDPRLRDAGRAVRAGDWPRATAIWHEVARTAPRAEIRARAEHDLAVAFEVQGQYRRALGHAERAVALDPTPRITRYRDELLAEIPARRELQRDLGAVAGPEGE